MPHITLVKSEAGRAGQKSYWGDILGTTITRNFRRDLAHAVEAEHNCDDNHCDIGEALKQGYVYVAAHSLLSATDELHELYAVLDAHAFNHTLPAGFGTHLYDNEDWEGWKEHFDANAVECPGCGAYCFLSDGDNSCDNCLTTIREETEDDE
jgi:hypothetical protein